MTYKTYEAMIDDAGPIRLLQTVTCTRSTRALVIVLEGEEPSTELTLQPTIVSDTAVSGSPTASWSKRYRPLRELGSGGMGKTILAERTSDRALVCLKFLHEGTSRAIFEQECRALLRLRHPAIIALLDFSLDDNPSWIATEFAPGTTLAAYLKDHGVLSPAITVRLLRILLEGLEHAHSQGVIHRDLKPANLIVDEMEQQLELRILDFGIAIVDKLDHEDNLTAESATPVGTVLYMAPEQLTSKLLTPACDIHATGLIAWQMLAGKHPFRATNPAALIYEKISCSGHRLDPTMSAPAELSEFIEAATQLDPDKRPTAGQALNLLTRCGV